MATRIRTLDFLPEIFQTPTNQQFLSATLDQLVNAPDLQQLQGYVGSRFGYGVNANDYYVTEPDATRTNYQLDPGVVFTKPGTNTATDFISYPGILNSINVAGGLANNNSRLFNSQFYSWDSFTNLDPLINFNQYYWLPEGPPAVTVSAATVYSAEDYVVTDQPIGYEITALGSESGSINPTLTLLRGGVYNFNVNQPTQFWIQGEPGVSGKSATNPNQSVRQVYGVDNNGAETGTVVFTVPNADAQNQYILPGNNLVSIVSNVPYANINGQPLSVLGNIDGVTSLNGLTVMFYDTGVVDEQGYTSSFYSNTDYDTNDNTITSPQTINITGTSTSGNLITCSSTANLVVNQSVTFTGVPLGTLIASPTDTSGNITDAVLYYVSSIVSPTQFTVSLKINGPEVVMQNASGSMICQINEGQYMQGYSSVVNSNFYKITYVGDSNNPIISLSVAGQIPINQKITAVYGNTYGGLNFYLDTYGNIVEIPYISAPLTTLYYQDGTDPTKVGVINIIDNNITNQLDVETQILGKKNFTSSNGVVFTNGLKVQFNGDVIPTSYLSGEYYVQGVGTAIQLLPVSDFIVPEPFTGNIYTPWDTTAWDIGNYDDSLYIPVTPDYITIAKEALNRNAWSRSNRWFHIDVITATAQYNNDPDIITTYATQANKAARPIIEFYPNLQLFNYGTVGKNPIDFIDFRTTDALNDVAGQLVYYPDVDVYTTYTATINPATSATSTTVTVNASAVTGTFEVGMYINDSQNILPQNSQITQIAGTTTLTITVEWANATTIPATSNVSLIANPSSNDNFALFSGARIVFANDPNQNTKIYIVSFSTLTSGSKPVITLSEAPDGELVENDLLVVLRGYNYQGYSFYYNAIVWIQAQQKVTNNQAPLFDVFDANGNSFGNPAYYLGTSFKGTKLFSYGVGTGVKDAVLGFPLRYSSVNNIGDISFDVPFNSDTFTYVNSSSPVTENVNTGFVYNSTGLETYERLLGWQTAIGPSVQYQVFEYNYVRNYVTPNNSFLLDVAPIASGVEPWPILEVYVNNTLQPSTNYTVATTSDSTTVTINIPNEITNTLVQILILSDQVSNSAFYTIPINLSNNPFNTDITTTNVGDIRRQYTSIFNNCPNTTGIVFGPNNYRDLGNLVPYGNVIIQNSASLVLPATFLRNLNYNIFDSLAYNSKKYVEYKNLIVYTVNSYPFDQRYDPAYVLNTAIDLITATKDNSQSFFWSDMIPAKAPYASNTYTFNSNLQQTIYPLTQTYNFATANYNGVLVYLARTVNGLTTTKQLVKGQEYTVSTTAPSLEITIDLIPGDVVTINEYNQTYGSYVPNTPTKLGLYPAFIPEVVLDTGYQQPTYFIKGHDGSYNKLYGDYIPATDTLVDFRDQALLEFEKRVYNNLKLSNTIPIQAYEVTPGFFRTTDYSYDEWLEIYTPGFLNWVGQNRLNYQQQFYNPNNQYTWNYKGTSNKVDNTIIDIGYWRGVYSYFYDTTTPESTPWEMLGYANEPSWWTARYGAAPYTSNNLVLWGDLAAGYDYNDGNPRIIPQAIRDGLLKVLPVDSQGNLVSPFNSVVKNYYTPSFDNDWVVGDDGPVEFSYRRSSSWPFDLMRILALTEPAEFFNLGVWVDNYKYNTEFNQYLVGGRSHLVPNEVPVYGSGTPVTSYINWIVDYQKQYGIDATTAITTLLNNLDVRLVYRLAGFSDQNLLNFYIQSTNPNANNSSLLIPNESYQVLLYSNPPYGVLQYSSVIVQLTAQNQYAVHGNSQNSAYFTTYLPKTDGNNSTIKIDNLSVKVANNYTNTEEIVPYGTVFETAQDLAQFLMSYGAYLEANGATYEYQTNAIAINWSQMVAEFLYWAQTGWQPGAITTLNPAAYELTIDRENQIVQPLSVQGANFVLNQNLYPIKNVDLSIVRDGTHFSVTPLNAGDTIAYGQFNLSNFENACVFDNYTLFGDTIYDLTVGLRQNRIYLRGAKTAAWNGTYTASGFIINQNNVKQWDPAAKYTKGQIVLYKNQYWIAQDIVQPSATFQQKYWLLSNYKEIQTGLLPNSSTNSLDSTRYYSSDQTALNPDANLLSYSLIGYRPRDYSALVDLTDVTQINVYQNLIKTKGSTNAVDAFKGATLPQGGIDYNVYENWAIQTSKYGGVLNNNFVQFKLNASELMGNPFIAGLTNGTYTNGVEQEVPLYSLYNYSSLPTDPNILPTTEYVESTLFPTAGYVNLNDVKMSAYFYSQLPTAINKNGVIVPLQNFYVGDYVWLANYLNQWNVYTAISLGPIVLVRSNLDNTSTVTFTQAHGLKQFDLFAIANFNSAVNGYYTVLNVVNNNQVVISLTLTASQTQIVGQGVGMYLSSQRVTTPADIVNLPLDSSEFVPNTVWTDINTDGSWAVYQKNINYQLQEEITQDQNVSLSFGTSVVYNNEFQVYLIGDPNSSKIYKYNYNVITGAYDLLQTITQTASFGSSMVNEGSTFVISQPTGTPTVYIYAINNSIVSNQMTPYQTGISAPGGVSNWGSALALSGDTNWLYISDTGHNKVYVYRKQNILLDAGHFTSGETYTITSLGTTDFTAIGAVENKVGIVFVATGAGSGTGTATQCTYKYSTVIDGSGFSSSGDNFGYSLATDYYGDTVVIGAPDVASGDISNWGSAYVYERSVQNLVAQYTNTTGYSTFQLAWTPTTTSTSASAVTTGSQIILNSVTGINVNDPVMFTGTSFGSTGLQQYVVYYVNSIVGSNITIKASRNSASAITLTNGSLTAGEAYIQSDPLYVSVNGTTVQDNNYAVVGSKLIYTGSLTAGDIINVSDNIFTNVQTLTTQNTPQVGVQFGLSLDTTTYASEIIVGAPFELTQQLVEGAVYRFTNGGGSYGQVYGTTPVATTAARTLLINGFAVTIPSGANATIAANTINEANIINVQAQATANNTLIISLINNALAQINEKLLVTALNKATFTELGITPYTQTQTVLCPHTDGPTQFGTTVKFNESGSFVASAPVGTRYEDTTFDVVEYPDNDTIFDNNTTQFIDTFPNAGAVYMFDYLGVYNETVYNSGAYVYAQNVNAPNLTYGAQPRYGTALDFIDDTVLIGTPNMSNYDTNAGSFEVGTTYTIVFVGTTDFTLIGAKSNTVGVVFTATGAGAGSGVATDGKLQSYGQVISYSNSTGMQDWSVYRQTAPIVDTSRIGYMQIFSAQTNNTLVNLDYFDPLQNKLLGAVAENLDVISNTDPASYNNGNVTQRALVWGSEHLGNLWFDITNVKFINYHQDDVVYNSTYWGAVFPGSDVAVYSWIASNVPPSNYQGPGTPYDTTLYSVEVTLNASQAAIPTYYFWVRNSNIIFTQQNKTLSDTVLESYISNPINSGISFISPVLPNVFSVYNSQEYLNGTDSVLNIGYATGTTDDEYHTEYALIKENYAEDFLPGLPTLNNINPTLLYQRLLFSLAGTTISSDPTVTTQLVPNPYLPIRVQSGIAARPSQSFFLDRFLALQNYLQYANTVMLQYPITEIREGATYLFESGPYYNTADYWTYVNWWASGYDDSIRSSTVVPYYADLSTLSVAPGTIVKVQTNGAGKSEWYIYETGNIWTRIGLQNGTIQFNSSLWDYASAGFGWGNNFYDTASYDTYPNVETYWIVRALTEQIYTNDLLIYRNQSLILLFQYIQSESVSSQNYLTWLNKTSVVDVSHNIRNLLPIENYESDNQDFLSGYLQEALPYHVFIKEFTYVYTGNELWQGNVSDFDLPAQYNTTIEKFVSPQLVYSNPDNVYTYLPSSPIWQEPEYNQWFNNYGVSLTGQNDFLISTVASYISLGSSTIVVANASGFPLNGVITIGTEQIAYSTVNRATNTLSNLIRGYNGTTISTHLANEKIYIDLPAVLLLNGGRGYINPPRVIAYIDTSIYPAPRTPAVLEAVMSLDTVVGVNVINPGEGYAVLPEILIDFSEQIIFASSSVNVLLNTIQIYAPLLQTGDLVKYIQSLGGTAVGGLENNQWYYVNVLQNAPAVIVALYTTYADAINDTNRVKLYNQGTGSDHTLNLGAKASAISTAVPVRENNITLKFDRTTYNSQVTDWKADAFYGSFFASDLLNVQQVSSSNILLQSTQPNINTIFASAHGCLFEIVDVGNKQQVEWSSLVRNVGQTISATNAIRLVPYSSDLTNASGSTIGMTVGMPIQFAGAVGVSGLSVGVVYYVAEVLSLTDFTISTTVNGSVLDLADQVIVSSGLTCTVAQVVNTATLTVNYPGIKQVTSTTANVLTNTGYFTVPTSVVGTGGTQGMYVGVPVFFTGNVFGGIIPNQTYYVNTILDNQNFTLSSTTELLTLEVKSTSSSTNYVTLGTTVGLKVNDPIVINNLTINDESVTSFGNILPNVIYYVNEIIDGFNITISTDYNGSVFVLGDVTEADDTYATLINQSNTILLTSGTGSMTMNISLPVSPGQVNGQLFTLYETSSQYPNISNGTISNQLAGTIGATIGSSLNYVAISSSSGTTNFYVNMPLQVGANIGGLTTGTTYYVTSIGTISVIVTATASSTNRLTTSSTSSLFVNMPIVFTGTSLGGISIGQTYFVKSIVDSTHFTISATKGGATFVLTTDNGSMTGTGEPYVTVSTSSGGSAVSLTSVSGPVTFEQVPTSSASFTMSYLAGGYNAIIVNNGSGFALTNTITISGTEVGGLSPANDVTLTVNSIDSNGAILSVIVSGTTPAGTQQQYYLRVTGTNTFEVYSNPLMTVPVSGLDFNYKGFTTGTVTNTTTGSNLLTISNASDFAINDPVIFTGNVPSNIPNITAGVTYYVLTIPSSTTMTISTSPGGSAVTLPTEAVNFTIATYGSFAFLPEPFYFNQSIVRFNNQLYICIVSNNDSEFIYGKWQLLDSSDNRINALDRIVGYYQPTVDMPGISYYQQTSLQTSTPSIDLSQLVSGITYPNSTYLGNPFQPSQQLPITVELQDEPFYPSDINLNGVVYNGLTYIATANISTGAATVTNLTDNTWFVKDLTTSQSGLTSINYNNGLYIVTSTNSATPILRSLDAVTWSSLGYYTANNTTSLNLAGLELYNSTYGNGVYVAVGSSIITSIDGINWKETYTFSGTLTNMLYGVTYVNIPAFKGFVAVGQGQRYDVSTGFREIVATDIILISYDGTNWTQVNPFSNSLNQPTSITYSGLYGVDASTSTIVAVGQNGAIYTSVNGSTWFGITETNVFGATNNNLNVGSTIGLTLNQPIRFSASFNVISAGTTYYVKSIVNSSQITISITSGGSVLTLNTNSPTTLTMLYAYPQTSDLNTVRYLNGNFVAIGANGLIRTSTDGINWTTQTSGTTENLDDVTYHAGTYTIVGYNNTILQSTNLTSWTDTATFTVAPAVYDVQGSAFTDGFGPEELVPGVVSDNLSMIVNTLPGTNWNPAEYAHNGYNVVSLELSPTSVSQTVYSFDNAVQTPAQIAVYTISYTTNLCTAIYNDIGYTVDWINNTITLTTPLSYSPSDKLRIDVYEVGNGFELVKSNTKVNPIVNNFNSGFDEIELDCNYSGTITNGNGVVRPGTQPIQTDAVATVSSTNSIIVTDASKFVLNGSVFFEGTTFGNIVENQEYYVKSISQVSDSITVSASLINGVAGATVVLTDAVGSMTCIIESGNGVFWSPPIVLHNGTKLVPGTINFATATSSATNQILCNSTSGLVANTPITFSNTMFGGITPLTTYYIKQIVDFNNFTISTTPNGQTVQLTDAVGGASFITSDYAVALAANGISAKLVFAAPYDTSVDYLTYTLFGETQPVQYGYTLPETQVYIGNGAQSSFTLSNYIGEANPTNAIVEVNGLRQTSSQYAIDDIAKTIVFTTPPANGETVAVTSYNLTDNQYLNTQYGISGSTLSQSVTVVVSATTHTVVSYDEGGTTGYSTDLYDELLNYLTLDTGYTTSEFTVGQVIVFSSPVIGGLVAGASYYITQIINSTDFVISTEAGGSPVTVTTDSGLMTGTINGITVADIISINNTITAPTVTTATATASTGNLITCSSTSGFVAGQPVQFSSTIIPVTSMSNGDTYQIISIGTTDFTALGAASNTVGITFIYNGSAASGTGTVLLATFGNIDLLGETYFVKTIASRTTFTIADENGNTIGLSNASGDVVVTEGGNTSVTITTGIPHGLQTNVIVRIDGTTGSTQLNNNTYYAKVISTTQFAIYTQPYSPAYNATNYPVTNISSYTGGGYVWRDGLFTIIDTVATATATDGKITAGFALGLIVGTPVYFTETGVTLGSTLLGGLIAGQEYYVSEILSETEFYVSATQFGSNLALTSGTGSINVTQWQQTNVDRLWVTVNGYRLPSSSLRINPGNDVSILTTIVPGDEVIITSMMPSATPNQMTYYMNVNQVQVPTVYNANMAKTWLTRALGDLDTTIYVNDVTQITETIVQNVTAPSAVNGIINIGLTVDKRTLTNVSVYNNTTGQTLPSSDYYVQVIDLAPTLEITAGVSTGDSLTIISLQGNLIYVNGEQIMFGSVNFTDNTISQLTRGANGTGTQTFIPAFTQVLGLLSTNQLSNIYYNVTWNPIPGIYNTTEGDPLQLAQTAPANFLNTGQ